MPQATTSSHHPESRQLSAILTMAARAQLRKFAADAANQLVTAVCAGIFMGLLYFLGRDFFHNKLSGADEAIKQGLYLIFFHLANAFLAKYATNGLSSQASQRSDQRTLLTQLTELQRWLGAAPQETRGLTIIMRLAPFVGVAVVLFLLARSPYIPYSALAVIGIFCGYCALMLALSYGFRRVPRTRPAQPLQGSHGAVTAMVIWRWRQLTRRNASMLFYGALGLLCLAAAAFWTMQGLDYRLVGFLFAMAGFFVAAPLHHQLAEDLTASWFERNNPISHRQIIASYYGLAAIHLLCAAIAAAACLGIAALFMAAPHEAPLITNLLDTLASKPWAVWLGLLAIAPILTPGLMFQVDGRKPLIQLMIGFMATIVLCSLVLIAPIAWLGVPLAAYIACHYQQGRYYRA